MDIHPEQIAIQLAFFLATVFVLKALIFQPLLKLHSKRIAQTDNKVKESEELTSRAQTLIQNYDLSIKETQAEVHRKILAAQHEGQTEAKQLLQKARQQGHEIFSRGKEQVEGRRAQIKQKLDSQREKITEEFVGVLLQ